MGVTEQPSRTWQALVALPILALAVISTDDVWWLALLVCLALATPALVWIDIQEHRLPNAIVAPLAAASLAVLLVHLVVMGDWGAVVRSGSLFLIVGGAAILLSLLTRGAMGMGDAKLIAVLALVLGFHSTAVLFAGLMAAFLLNGVWSLGILVASSLRGRSAVGQWRAQRTPFGPALLLGAWLAVFFNVSISSWLGNLPTA